jgi:flagellar protein FlgJ
LQGFARPTPALSSAGAAGFGGLFGQVRGEVEDFIANGSQGSSASNESVSMPFASGSLSVEGQALRNGIAGAGSAGGDGASGEAQQQFLAGIAPWAQETGERLGVSPDIVAAHAALESGWGRKPLRQADGGDTNNLFGIKAGGAWQGSVASALTTEHEQGADVKKVERFRSYPDQASAFRDYTHMLLDNPRYRSALNTGTDARAFAQGLARGGYATDPAYADKLARLATRIQSGE